MGARFAPFPHPRIESLSMSQRETALLLMKVRFEGKGGKRAPYPHPLPLNLAKIGSVMGSTSRNPHGTLREEGEGVGARAHHPP